MEKAGPRLDFSKTTTKGNISNDEKASAGSSATQELITNLTNSNPSERVIGLPGAQLNLIARFTNQSALELLRMTGSTAEDFIQLCNAFDQDIIDKEYQRLSNEVELSKKDLYIQRRILDVIAHTIERAGFDLNKTTDVHLESKMSISLRVIDFYSGRNVYEGIKNTELFEGQIKAL